MEADTNAGDRRHCRQCGNDAIVDLGALPQGKDFAGHTLDPPWQGGHLCRCRRCGLVFRDPVQPEGDYESLYETAPATLWGSPRQRGDRKHILAWLHSASTGRVEVLDVGCYDGSLLSSLDARFEKYGVEASRPAAALAETRGVTIVARTVRELDGISRTFDVVIAVDLIEHVLAPAALLMTLLRLTRPGGLTIVSTGNADAAPWRLAGPAYWYSEFPEHISFISESWARRFAAQHGLQLSGLTRFSYYDEDVPGRWRARARFCIAAVKGRARQRLLRLLTGASVPPRWLLGEPNLFADHFICAFRKP